MPNIGQKPTRADVVSAYKLILWREPESLAVVDDIVEHSTANWIAGFFRSDEFRLNVLDRLQSGDGLVDAQFDARPGPALINWAVDILPLDDMSRARMRRAVDRRSFLLAVLSDGRFVADVFGDEQASIIGSQVSIGLLADASRSVLTDVQGAVELVSESAIAGWAIDVRDIDRTLAIELHVGGRFVSAGSTHLFRREIQDQFGGRGHCGFRFDYDPTAALGRFGEVREAASGMVLGAVMLPSFARPPLDAVGVIRQELDQLRATLARIESHLPSFHRSMGFALSAYPEYYLNYYSAFEAPRAEVEPALDIALILDASGLHAPMIQAGLASVSRQHRVPRDVILVHDAYLRLEIEALAGRFRMTAQTTTVTAIEINQAGWATAMNAAVAHSATSHLIFARADGALSPAASDMMAEALQSGSKLVFADEDTVETSPDGGILRHVSPTFRTAFDPDLLRQQDCVGDLVGVERAVAEKIGFRSSHERSRLYDFLLRVGEMAEPAAMTHIDRVLLHRFPGAEAVGLDARMDALEDHVARVAPGSVVEQHVDQLGAIVPGATRIRARLTNATKTTIIVPTRDRLDLLGPCLASVATSIPHNRAEIEIVVVDNRSTAATTRDFLRTISANTKLRVLDHDGEFNWALINNRAAEQVDCDVLVFLNNDTVVLSPDCWDELSLQAMRPDVGAVGARLLYEGGTIQHAGMVLSDWNDIFTMHEGMGCPGNDPGYLGRHALLRQVSCVTGACLATRAGLFREMGGFDDARLPVEGNDTDYCMRLNNTGYRILYDPYVTLYHFESKSRGFNIDSAKCRMGSDATSLVRERWARKFQRDTFYNFHFDRLSPPGTRLRAPQS